MKGYLQGIGVGAGLLLAVVLLILALIEIIDRAEDIRIVAPKQGVGCVIVTRMANVSIDCWAERREPDGSWHVEGYAGPSFKRDDTQDRDIFYNQGVDAISIGTGEELLINRTDIPETPSVSFVSFSEEGHIHIPPIHNQAPMLEEFKIEGGYKTSGSASSTDMSYSPTRREN